MQLRGLYGALAAMVLTIILAGSAVVYAHREDERLKQQNRADVVLFVCAAIAYSDEEDIRHAFLMGLSQLGHTCPE